MRIGEARKIASSLDGAIDGWTSADYKGAIDTSGFLKCDGCTVEINWGRIDQFADEVAARAIMQFANNLKVKKP